LLEDESFEPLKSLIEELLQNTDQNKQRGAAEFLAGLLNGMVLSRASPELGLIPSSSGAKHWPADSQKRLWDWAMPLIKKTLDTKIKTDTLSIWSSFLEVGVGSYGKWGQAHQVL